VGTGRAVWLLEIGTGRADHRSPESSAAHRERRMSIPNLIVWFCNVLVQLLRKLMLVPAGSRVGWR